MQGLIGPLKELAEFEELCKNKKKDQLLRQPRQLTKAVRSHGRQPRFRRQMVC